MGTKLLTSFVLPGFCNGVTLATFQLAGTLELLKEQLRIE